MLNKTSVTLYTKPLSEFRLINVQLISEEITRQLYTCLLGTEMLIEIIVTSEDICEWLKFFVTSVMRGLALILQSIFFSCQGSIRYLIDVLFLLLSKFQIRLLLNFTVNIE